LPEGNPAAVAAVGYALKAKVEPMTIAKRLTLLSAVPLVALIGLGTFTRVHWSTTKQRTRFVAETQVGSLSSLGDISRDFEELRVRIRAYAAAVKLTGLLGEFDPGAEDFIEANRAALQPLFPDEGWSALEELVQGYAFAEAQAMLEHAASKLSNA